MKEERISNHQKKLSLEEINDKINLECNFKLEQIVNDINFDSVVQLLAKINDKINIKSENDLNSLEYLVIKKNVKLQTGDIKVFFKAISLAMPNINNLSSFSPIIQQICFENHQSIQKIICQSNSLLKKVWLRKLSKLQKLYFQNCQMLKQLKIQGCLNLEILNLSKSSINQQNLQQILVQTLHLKTLILAECKSIRKIKIKDQNSLQKLDISKTQIQFLELISLQKLNHLNLNACFFLKTLHIMACKNINQINMLSLKEIEQILFQSLEKLRKVQLSFKGKSQTIRIGFHLYKSVHYILKTIKSIKIINCPMIKKITVVYAKINSIELKRVQNVQTIQFILCEMKWIQFDKLQKVKKLNLYYSQIDQKQFQTCLQSMPNIQNINVFECLKQTFNLSKLKLKRFDLNYFKTSENQFNQLNLQRIERLTLFGCSMLQNAQLSNLNKITVLNLTKFKILTLSVEPFTNSKQKDTRQIQMENKKMQQNQCHENKINQTSLMKIQQYRKTQTQTLKYGQIQTSFKIIFKSQQRKMLILNPFLNLKQLNLSNNNLKNIEMIASISLEQLVKINLSYNYIVSLSPFKKLKKLPYMLDLKCNYLRFYKFKIYGFNLFKCRLRLSETLNVLDQFTSVLFLSQKILKKIQNTINQSNQSNFNEKKQIKYHIVYL